MSKHKITLEVSLKLIKRVKAFLYTMMIRKCFYSAGKNVSINPPFKFGNLYKIKLGDKVTIHKDCWISVQDEYLKPNTPHLIIGSNTSIGARTIISAVYNVVIKNDVMIAPNVYISDYGHNYESITKPISKQGIRKVTKVEIEEGCWIGYNSIIMPGAMIGKNCVIGANSVVNSVIPDYSIACGSPAVVIKIYDPISGNWVRPKHE